MTWVKSLSDTHPCFGFASDPVDDQRYVDGSEHEPGSGGVSVSLTSCHCWLAPFASPYWTTAAPSAVDEPVTSTVLLLLRLISLTKPLSVSARRNCWLVPLLSAHCWTFAPSAVDRPLMSRILLEFFDFSR